VRSAFTLIELVTVIALLGIVALFVGGPALSSLNDLRGQAAAARLTGDARYMQRMALNSGLRTWMVFSTAANNYRLYVEDPNNPGKAGRLPVVHPSDQTSGPVQFGAGPFLNVTIASVNINSTSELEFDSWGAPYDGNGAALVATARITLSGGIIVTVYPLSGLVERTG
jgi:prepilin-type N-terminal cleavage/methylation domain-containing protein